MNVVRTRACHQGFSLVEAIIAIGVLTVAMTAMLGVLPGGMNQARQASEQGRALAWLETIAADLRLARSTGSEVSPRFELRCATSGNFTLLLTEDGAVVTSPAAARYRVSGRLLTSAVVPETTHLRATWPVQAKAGREEGAVEIISSIEP